MERMMPSKIEDNKTLKLEKNSYSHLTDDFLKQLEIKDIQQSMDVLDSFYHEYELINEAIFMVESGALRLEDSSEEKIYEYKILISKYALIDDLYSATPSNEILSESPAILPIVASEIKKGLIGLGNRYYEFLSDGDKAKYKIFDPKSSKKNGYDGFSHRYEFNYHRNGFSREESQHFLNNNPVTIQDFNNEIDELNMYLFAYEKYFKIKKEDLTLGEWYFLHQYLKNHNLKSFSYSSKIIKSFNNPNLPLRAFLSIEHGGKEMGDKILTLGEKLPKVSAEKLFEKYGEIINEVDNITAYLSKSLGENPNPELIQSAQDHLLIKGRNLLNHYAKSADTCKNVECEDLGRELEEKLSNIKASLLLFASACKSLSEQKLLSIEDLANTELDIVRGEVEQKSQEEMLRIFRENRPNYSDALLADSIKEFESSLKNTSENQTWYILKNGGDIASFMRLDDMEDGSIYGAAFNVRTELRGSSIGSELLQKIIEEKSQTQPFKIICYENNPMLKKYVEDFKFKIIGEIPNYHNTGKKFYEMTRESKVTE